MVAAVFAVASTTHPEWGATWFICFVAIFGTVGAFGLYMIGAVYFGWPLPTTHAARIRKPDIKISAPISAWRAVICCQASTTIAPLARSRRQAGSSTRWSRVRGLGRR